MKSLLFFALMVTLGWINQVLPQSNKLMLKGKPHLLTNEFIGVKDINGKFCAGIAIVSDKDGFVYESNMGVVKVDDKPGRDIVYLSPEEQVLDIYLAGFTPLRLILHDIGITLHPKELWEIQLETEEYFRLDSLPVAIVSEPQYDEIQIDGQPHGQGPIHMLVQGTHILRIKIPGYRTLSDTIKVDKDHLRFEYTLQEEEYSRFQVTSQPAGAAIYLDDIYAGTTPLEIMYPIGTHILRLEKDGYQKVEQLIQITKPFTKKHFILDKLQAYLQINTYDYARITVDGKLVPANTRLSMMPKLVTLKIYVAGFDSTERTIPLKPNKLQKINFYPKFPSGNVQISADPLNAVIKLYDFKKRLIAQDTAQLVLRKLPATSYVLHIAAPGFEDDRETIVVIPERTTTRIVHLTPQQTQALPKGKPKIQADHDHASWRSIVLLNTIPREPGDDIFRWTWNPAAIQKGVLIAGGGLYEDYNLSHETYPHLISNRLKITNQIYRGGIFIGGGPLQLGFNYAKRIKSTAETHKQNTLGNEPLHAYKEISEIVSLTLGIRFDFGLAIAARGNLHKIQFVDRVKGFEPWNKYNVRTFDVGLEQNFDNVLFLDIFSNGIKEYVDNTEIRYTYLPHLINASATLHLNNLWVTGGVRLTRRHSFSDSLLFLRANLQMSKTLWLNSFYSQSHHYKIIDMNINMITPVVIMGGGLHLNLDGLILGYQVSYLKFSSVAIPDGDIPITNIIKRNHLRHELSLSLAL